MKTENSTATTLVNFFKQIFTRYGIPNRLVSDIGTPAVSQLRHEDFENALVK